MKKILVEACGGIGNILQIIPLVKMALRRSYEVHIVIRGCTAACKTLFDKWKAVTVVNKKPFIGYTHSSRCLSTDLTRSITGRHVPWSRAYIKGEANCYCTVLDDGDDGDDHTAPLHSNLDFTKYKDCVVVWAGCKKNWSVKRWPYYSTLIDRLAKPILIGQAAASSKVKLPGHAINLLDTFDNLNDLAALIRHTKGFIGNDGGIAHLSATTGVETFILFGGSSDVKNLARGKHVHLVAHDIKCRPCQKLNKKEDAYIFHANKCYLYDKPRCMTDLTIDHVIAKLPSNWLR